MIRLVLLVAAALLFVAFAVANWTPVPLVFGATVVTIRLPVLLLAVLLAGALPYWARFRLTRRRLRAAVAAPELRLKHPQAVSQAEPTIVPPGCG